jgi:hypothetical protein
MVRAPSVCAFLYQNAHAKSEFAYLRKNMGGAERQPFLRAPREVSEGKSERVFLVRSLPRGKE